MQRNDCLKAEKNSKKQLIFEAYSPVEFSSFRFHMVQIDDLSDHSPPKKVTSKANANTNTDIIPQKTIFEVVATEDFEYMGKLLERSDAIQPTRDYFAQALITNAIRVGNLLVIHYLLQQGAKIPCNHTVDMQALRSEFILHGDYGSLYRMGQCKINEIDSNIGLAPIHLAVIKNDLDMVKFLLFCHADVNSLDGFGNSALHLAVSSVNVEMVELLLKNNANPRLANKQNLTVINLLDNMSHSTKLHLIKQHIEQSPKIFSEEDNAILKAYEEGRWANDKILSSDLIVATNKNDIQRVKVLLNLIVVQNTTKAFSHAVHMAIENGNLDLVKLFLQKCGNMASFLQVFSNGETPIAHAIRSHKEEITSFLAKQSNNMQNHNTSYYHFNPEGNQESVDNFQHAREIIAGLGSADIAGWFS